MSTTTIIQASLGQWFPRPTRKAPSPSGRGFVLFLVLQVERDLRHLFGKKTTPGHRTPASHVRTQNAPKTVHHHTVLYGFSGDS